MNWTYRIGNHENPELIWNDDSRERVGNMVREMKDSYFEEQKNDPEALWKVSACYCPTVANLTLIKIPEEFEMMHAGSNEVVIGGVFLRLLIKQPNWSLRKPKEFLVAVLVRHRVGYVALRNYTTGRIRALALARLTKRHVIGSDCNSGRRALHHSTRSVRPRCSGIKECHVIILTS